MALTAATAIDVWDDVVGAPGIVPTETKIITYTAAIRDYIIEPIQMTDAEVLVLWNEILEQPGFAPTDEEIIDFAFALSK